MGATAPHFDKSSSHTKSALVGVEMVQAFRFVKQMLGMNPRRPGCEILIYFLGNTVIVLGSQRVCLRVLGAVLNNRFLNMKLYFKICFVLCMDSNCFSRFFYMS